MRNNWTDVFCGASLSGEMKALPSTTGRSKVIQLLCSTFWRRDTFNPRLCCSQAQLDAMKLNRLHAVTGHSKPREEKGELWLHQKARRASSDDNSRSKSAIPENSISTIPELTESFGRRLRLRDARTMSLVSDDYRCNACPDRLCV